MPKIYFIACCIILLSTISCNAPQQNNTAGAGQAADSSFKNFETRFLDSYWNQYPSASIFIGYGKYYENLVIPDSTAFVYNSLFSTHWLDSLHQVPYDQLNDNYKISYHILENQLQSDRWYNDTLKQQEWNPGSYNLSGESYYILTQPYASLDQRLKILSKHLEHADAYYAAALYMIHQPTREHTDLAIRQSEGGLDVFGTALTDSINSSHLNPAEKDSLHIHVDIT